MNQEYLKEIITTMLDFYNNELIALNAKDVSRSGNSISFTFRGIKGMVDVLEEDFWWGEAVGNGLGALKEVLYPAKDMIKDKHLSKVKPKTINYPNTIKKNRTPNQKNKAMIEYISALKMLGKNPIRLGAGTLLITHKGCKVMVYPHKDWFSGKTVIDGRGLNNLLNQLKK